MQGMYFGNRRPRGFRHTYRFAKEQGEVTRRLLRGDTPGEIASDSEREYRQNIGVAAMSRLGKTSPLGRNSSIGCVVLLLVALLAVMAMAFFVI